jgi:hypothetical protein
LLVPPFVPLSGDRDRLSTSPSLVGQVIHHHGVQTKYRRHTIA